MTIEAISSEHCRRPSGRSRPRCGPASSSFSAARSARTRRAASSSPAGSKPKRGRFSRNLATLLDAAGKSFGDVVRVGVFLTDIADFAAVNAIYAARSTPPFPARTTVAVAALPLGAPIEIELLVKELKPMRYDFMIVDVFTDVAFGGNQLAVLTDARGLTSEAMQTITREFDFPETTFLLPPRTPRMRARVRIFTPGRELPFAGHPTVGTACALVMSGACRARRNRAGRRRRPGPGRGRPRAASAFSGRFRLERAPEVPDRCRRTPTWPRCSRSSRAKSSTCSAPGLASTSPSSSSADREAVDRAQLDHPAWRRVLADHWGSAGLSCSPATRRRRRRFMRGCSGRRSGSPKTRRRAAPRRRSSARRRSASDRRSSLDIRQGVKMGRPSLIRTSATVEGGRLRAIDVGGGCASSRKGRSRCPTISWRSA